jgi:hypothetical protein
MNQPAGAGMKMLDARYSVKCGGPRKSVPRRRLTNAESEDYPRSRLSTLCGTVLACASIAVDDCWII